MGRCLKVRRKLTYLSYVIDNYLGDFWSCQRVVITSKLIDLGDAGPIQVGNGADEIAELLDRHRFLLRRLRCDLLGDK